MKYRSDSQTVNAAGQTEHFASWMGGPTLSKVEQARCPDGKDRTAFVTGDADTFFSLPATVNDRGRKLKGYLTHDDGVWSFHSLLLAPEEVLPNVGNCRVKVGDRVLYREGDDEAATKVLARVIGFAPKDGLGVEYAVPRLLVLALNEMGTDAFIRHVDQEDVLRREAPAKDGAFAAFFAGGPLASAEKLVFCADAGGLSERYFAESCDRDGTWIPFTVRAGKAA